MPNTLLLIAQVLVILVMARLCGSALKALGQPRVMGEMVAGLVLGPSVFGALAPALSQQLFPAGSLGFLNALSQVGLIFFMFLVGLELDLGQLRRQGRAALAISNSGIAVPFALGALLALWLYPRLSSPTVGRTAFVLFLGVAMSVTAFPVLARILADRGLLRTRVGTVAIAAAAVDDVTAWCLLAVVVMVARGASASHAIPLMVIGSLAWTALMLFALRPLLRRLAAARADEDNISGFFALVVATVLASAWVTEWLGVHAVFGAFLAGVAMPREDRLSRPLTERLHDLMTILFLPLFFAFTGLRTSVALIGAGALGYLALILLVAVAGKLGGSLVAARLGGMTWRDATAIGILMNTRGLMELVVLNVGLDIGIISPGLFAMMVIMALVTTFMTTPLLSLVSHATVKEPRAESLSPAR